MGGGSGFVLGIKLKNLFQQVQDDEVKVAQHVRVQKGW